MQEQTHAAYLGRLRQVHHLLQWQREQVESKLATALQLLENAEGGSELLQAPVWHQSAASHVRQLGNMRGEIEFLEPRNLDRERESPNHLSVSPQEWGVERKQQVPQQGNVDDEEEVAASAIFP